MDEYKGPQNGNIQTSYINDDDFVDQHDGPFNLARKYMGTAADQHDMSVLGRNQVLRVSKLSTSLPCAQSVDIPPRSATFASSRLWASVVPSFVHGRSYWRKSSPMHSPCRIIS